MLRIRLARTGKKKLASYRVVVADQKRAVQAKFVEILGWYNPHTKDLEVNKEKLESWLSKGASPSNSIAKLFKKSDIELPEWVKIVEKNKKPKKEEAKEEKKEAPKAQEASAEPAVEEKEGGTEPNENTPEVDEVETVTEALDETVTPEAKDEDPSTPLGAGKKEEEPAEETA